MAYRKDSGSIGEVTRTPQGGLRVPAYLTRTGVFTYYQDGNPIREYRSPEEVFRADSLATLQDAPVTDLHPPVLVNPDNFQEYNRGNVQHGSIKQDGDRVEAALVIQEGVLIGAVERRDRKEVSCGYECDIDNTPGVTPTGERFDRKQINIRYNHVAIVPHGRAGSSVALRLDSDGNQTEDTQEKKAMKTIKIDGVDYPLGTPAEQEAAVNAFNRWAKRADGVEADLATARKDADTQRGRADAAEGRVKTLEADLATANDPARMDKLVKDRQALIRDAQTILGADFKADGLSTKEIMIKALAKADNTIRTDSVSEDYLQGAFRGLVKRADAENQEDPDGLGRLDRALGRKDHQEPESRTDAEDPSKPENIKDPKRRADAMSRSAYLHPLAFHKDN